MAQAHPAGMAVKLGALWGSCFTPAPHAHCTVGGKSHIHQVCDGFGTNKKHLTLEWENTV